MSIQWPSLADYQGPVANAKRCISDMRLHSMQIEMMPGTRQPKVRSGGYGGVYKFTGDRKSLALKVFTKAQGERDLRYKLIFDHLSKNSDLDCLIEFNHNSQG